jgi:uncharacterized protein (TIRG00374 family)
VELNRRHIAAGILAWLAVFSIFVILADPTEFVDAATDISQARLAAMVGLKLVGTVLMGLVLYTVARGIGLDLGAIETIFLNATVGLAKKLTPFGQASGLPIGGLIVSQWTGEPFEEGLAAVSMKEIIGFAPSILVFLFGGSYIVFYDPAVSGRVRSLVGLFTLGVAAFVAIAALVYRNPGAAQEILQRLAAALNRGLARLPRVPRIDEDDVRNRVEGFVESMQRVTSDIPTVAVASVLRTTATVTQGALLWVTLGGVGVDISLALAVFAIPVSLLAAAVPLPGGTGGIESAQILLILGIAGGNESAIITAVVVSRGIVFWMPVVIGSFTLTGIQVKKWWSSSPG